jgi:hypothetical protein
MTLGEINTKIGNLINDPNSVAYTAASRVIDLNIWNQKIVSMILDSQDEVSYDDPNQTTYPIFKVPLTANRDIQIPTSVKMLKIKSISVCYDGSNIYRSTPFDIDETNLPVADAANTAAQAAIDGRFSKTSPRVDVKFGALWTYPMASAADVAAGGYIIFECFREPYVFTTSDLSTGTLTPGFDGTFHAMLAYGPAKEYALPKQLPQLKGPEGILATLADYEARLRQQYSSKQLDRRQALTGDDQNYK